MHKQKISIICFLITLVLLAAILSSTPVWSGASDKKPEINKSTDIAAKELTTLKAGGEGKRSVKKKAVKKAGTTAAIGIAGAKVKSGVKGKVTKN